jgi:hypothetical protein
MKTIMTTVAVLALTVTFSAPAMAQQADEQVAAKHSGGQCAISQAMLAAMADGGPVAGEARQGIARRLRF